MVSGNSMANIYVQGAAGWHEWPDFDARGRKAAALKARLIEHSAIEHVIYRAHEPGTFVACESGGALRLRLEAGQASCESRISWTSEGKNPLGYSGSSSPADREEIARVTADSEYRMPPGRSHNFFGSRRAGDLVGVCTTRV